MTDKAAFDVLTPDAILGAVESALKVRLSGLTVPHASYINRVYELQSFSGERLIAKFYRPGRWSDAQILEEHAFASELAAHEIPLAAPWPLTPDPQSLRAVQVASRGPTLAAFDTVGGPYRFAVTTRMAGRAPEVEDPSVLEWIGRFIGRMHAIGATGRFETRLALNPITYGTEPRDWLLSKDLVPPDALTAWRAMAEAALDQVRAAFDSVTSLKLLRLHGDCHLGNILWTDAGPHFVDLDDAVTGPAVQDLWMLLSGNRAERTRQLGAVLDGYEQFMDFDRRELALIEPLRTLRMIHHSAWIARRWRDPAFPIAFPWFESPSYWMEQATRLRDQLEAMAEAPLVA